MSKGRCSRRQPSLLELSQPESWHQLNRDIQQRMQYSHPHMSTASGTGDSSSRPQGSSNNQENVHVSDGNFWYTLDLYIHVHNYRPGS